MPTTAAGSGSPGHRSLEDFLQIKSFSICILAEWYFEDSLWMTWLILVMPIKKLCNSVKSLKKKSIPAALSGF